MPSITIRSFAEMMSLPAHAQVRILTDQKYPRTAPASYRTPYYRQAQLAIRGYFAAGNTTASLAQAKRLIAASSAQPSRRDNNIRAINEFAASAHASRRLTPQRSPRGLSRDLAGLELRLSFDLVADDSGSTKYIFYNLKSIATGRDLARTTLELGHWVLSAQRGAAIKDLEFVDLPDNKVYVLKSTRAGTLKIAAKNAQIITTLWPTI